jgi:hypothetical protein
MSGFNAADECAAAGREFLVALFARMFYFVARFSPALSLNFFIAIHVFGL